MKKALIQLSYALEKADRRLLIGGLAVLALIVRISSVMSILSSVGIQYGGDTERYNAWALGIAEKGLGYYAENLDKPYYWGYPTVLFICRTVFGSDLAAIWVNILASAAGVIYLFLIARLITKSNTTAAVCCIFYCYSNQLMAWDSALYSDSLGLFLMLGCFWHFFSYMEQGRRSELIRLIIMAVPYYLVRTTSVIALAFMAAGIILKKSGKNRKKVLLAAGICLGAAIGFFVFLLLTSKGEHGVLSRVRYYIGLFESGTVVFETDTFVYPVHFAGSPLFILDVLGIILCRLVFFWAIFFKRFPIYEKILNCLTLLPIVILGFTGAVMAIRKKERRLWPVIGFVALTNVIQSFFEIDGSHRYRMPVLPFMMLLSAWTINELVFVRLRAGEKSP